MEISRRFFIFGSAAALASVALPAIVTAIPEQIRAVKTSSPAKGMRRVTGFHFMAEDNEAAWSEGVMAIKISRQPGNLPMFQMAANARAKVRWIAGRDGPLPFPEGSLMVVESTGVLAEAWFHGYDGNGNFVESYNFTNGALPICKYYPQ
jgi:hypothetical protein